MTPRGDDQVPRVPIGTISLGRVLGWTVALGGPVVWFEFVVYTPD